MDTTKIKENLIVYAKDEGRMQAALNAHLGTVELIPARRLSSGGGE